MKQKPILFSTAMVQAILNGSKTQTRRMVKMYKSDEHPLRQNSEWFIENKTCPYGKVGDVLWVRESWSKSISNIILYKASRDNGVQGFTDAITGVKWKPSIHLKKIDCRIWLQITNIRVERLHDITEEDALSEGIKREFDLDAGEELYYFYPCNDLRDDSYLDSAKVSFYSLWRSINGEQSWQQNPWVWVIEFKQIDKPNN